jgi:hypothetical protein
VQAIFVGTLISIGVCMVALKGNTEPEDILLNVGGMLAPAVALVPTPGEGGCRSVPVTLSDTPANIANNMSAVFITGALGLVITVGIAIKARGTSDWDRRHIAGIVVAALILVGGIAWFIVNRSGFTTGAHYTAAIALFVCIIGVVLLNAWVMATSAAGATDLKSVRAKIVNRYSVIAGTMVASLLLMGLWKSIFGWDHALLWIEGTLIALFASFWLAQTLELWEEGLRRDAGGSQPAAAHSTSAERRPSPSKEQSR